MRGRRQRQGSGGTLVMHEADGRAVVSWVVFVEQPVEGAVV
jgi:hypothetical protein